MEPDPADLESEAMDASTANRRVDERKPFEGPIGFVPVDANGDLGTPVAVHAQNISAGGLCLVSPEVVASGTQAVVQLVRDGGRLALLGARVCYCRPNPDGTDSYILGISFGAMPPALDTARLRDDRGRVMLLDPRLRDAF